MWQNIFNHANSDHTHADKVLKHYKESNHKPTNQHDMPMDVLLGLQKGKLSHGTVTDLLDSVKEHMLSPDQGEDQAHDKYAADNGDQLAFTAITNLPQNRHLTPEAIQTIKNHSDAIFSTSRHLNSAMKERIYKELAKHPNTSPETLDQIFNSARVTSTKHEVLKNPNVSVATAQSVFGKTPYVAGPGTHELAQHALRNHGIFGPDTESVSVTHNTSKPRQVRDWINAHGGSMHYKELAAAGMNVDAMGMTHLKDAKGNLTSDGVQKHIDAQPSHEYIVTHSKYGFDPNEDYLDEDHPKHSDYVTPGDENYAILRTVLGEDHPKDSDYAILQPPDPNDEQRHSVEPSQVFQLSVTPDHIHKMKAAGVWDTFRNMNKDSLDSGHPAANVSGIGWVRYTKGKDGIFVDEIQSDVGSSLVRKTRAIANKQVAAGQLTQAAADAKIKQAGAQFPEDHYNKIKDIVFGGKESGEVLHEAFHQHLRDKGMAGTPIHIWSSQGKGKMSLQENQPVPAHMIETYDKHPKKMGYVPAKYGELETQNKIDGDLPNSKDWTGSPTLKTTLRKTEKPEK
jgi:hypothetical protein